MNELRLKHCTVDMQRGKAHSAAGKKTLTTKELALLRYLAEHPGEIVTRDDLLVEVWGYREGVVSRAVDTTMRRLRNKVEHTPADPDHLTTVHGEGYRFVEASQAHSLSPPAPPETAIPIGAAAPGLPPMVQPLIGRRTELAELETLLDSARLLTVIGPGGMGKSRLALSLAHDCLEKYEGSVWWVAAVEGAGESAIVEDLARQLGLAQSKTPEVTVQLIGQALQVRGPALLLLDDLDGERADTLGAAESWLTTAPELRILIASRSRTLLSNEQVYPLGPLADEDAVTLFIERARMLRPEFDPDEEVRATIQSLAEALDGMPLAIEMAAGRCRLMSPEQILIRIGHSVTFLEGSAPGATSRHKGILQMMASSWEELSDDEKAVLMGCTVFRGGFSVEAAEAILQAQVDRLAVMNHLQELADSSWLSLQSTDSGVRCSLYGPIRAFVERHPTTSQLTVLKDAHLEWFASEAQARGEDIEDRANSKEIAWLAIERPNLMAALAHAADTSPPHHAQLARVLVEADGARGATLELGALLAGPAVPLEESPVLARAQLVTARAFGLRILGQFARAQDEVTVALELAEQCEDPDLDCGARYIAAWLAWDQRDFEQTDHHLDVLAARSSACSTERWELKRSFMRCYIDARAGQLDSAIEAGKHSIRLASTLGRPRREALTHQVLGQISRDRNDIEDAIHHSRKATQIFEQIGDARNVAYLKNAMAMLYAVDQRYEDSGPLLDAALEALEHRVGPHARAIFMGNRGAIHLALDELVEADECLWESLRILDTAGIPRGRGFYEAYLGATRALMGRTPKAKRCMERAEQALVGAEFKDIEPFMAAIRAHLDVGEARQALTAGDNDAVRTHLQSARDRGLPTQGESWGSGVLAFAQHLLQQAIDQT
jgi:predicted ATPase/DNA-binding winged helix-turn-helix (wHTH) protein